MIAGNPPHTCNISRVVESPTGGGAFRKAGDPTVIATAVPCMLQEGGGTGRDGGMVTTDAGKQFKIDATLFVFSPDCDGLSLQGAAGPTKDGTDIVEIVTHPRRAGVKYRVLSVSDPSGFSEFSPAQHLEIALSSLG